jgi:hypothetical protein
MFVRLTLTFSFSNKCNYFIQLFHFETFIKNIFYCYWLILLSFVGGSVTPVTVLTFHLLFNLPYNQNLIIMAIEVITREDLNEFRFLLLNDLKDMLEAKPQQQKRWLKSNEVKELLGISSGTLQNLRINKTLPYSKVNGTIFYTLDSIEKLLEQNKSHANPTLFK